MDEKTLWSLAHDFIKSFPDDAKSIVEGILSAVKFEGFKLRAGVSLSKDSDGFNWLQSRFYLDESWTFDGSEFVLSRNFWNDVENSAAVCESEFFDIPKKASAGAACFDIQSADNTEIAPRHAGIVRTGLKFKLPENHVLLIFSRSGHGFKHNVRLSNCVGVIDSDYRGELKVSLQNDSDETFSVRYGDRVAQGLIVPIPQVAMVAGMVTADTARGAGGFGSTGV